MTLNPLSQFVADAEHLLERDGKVGVFSILGATVAAARYLQNAGLIVVGSGRALEITVQYAEDGRVIQNPVYCRAANGDLIRVHSEWIFGRRRLARLLAGELPDGAITIGRDERGSTIGLD